MRATGTTGFVGVSDRPGSAEWFAGVLFGIALIFGLVAPELSLTGTVEPLDAFNSAALNLAGLAVALLGLGLTLYAQMAMGSSWWIGVNPDERTKLVTSGPFALVRNPIFSAMIPTALGLAMMVPSVISVDAVVALLVALQLQVRVVEEPYLLRVQGKAYRDYAHAVGRFIPGLGRLESAAVAHRRSLGSLRRCSADRARGSRHRHRSRTASRRRPTQGRERQPLSRGRRPRT